MRRGLGAVGAVRRVGTIGYATPIGVWDWSGPALGAGGAPLADPRRVSLGPIWGDGFQDAGDELAELEASGLGLDGMGDVGWFGSSIVRSIGKAASGVAHGFSSLAHLAEKALHEVSKIPGLKYLSPALILQGAKILGPVWNIAQTGVSFIPGVGSAVSAGMAAAAALGRGESLKDIGLAAAKNALPGGPLAAAAFDVAIGLANGKNIGAAALAAARSRVPGGDLGKAAFDAAISVSQGHKPDLIRAVASAIPNKAARQAFGMAVAAAKKTRSFEVPRVVPFPGLALGAQTAATALQRNPWLRRMSAPRVAQRMGGAVNPMEVRQAIAAMMKRWGGANVSGWNDVGELETCEQCAERCGVDTGAWAPRRRARRLAASPGSRLTKRIPGRRMNRRRLLALYRLSNAHGKRAILAHGFLVRHARDVGELVGPGRWTIRSGDYPSGLAVKLTGNAARWRELLLVNPGMRAYQDKQGRTQLSGWTVGATVNVPPAWFGSEPMTAPSSSSSPSSSSPWATPSPSAIPSGGSSNTFTVRSGDVPYSVAKRLTGDANRWRELPAANPGMRVYSDSAGRTQLSGWTVGATIRLPASWPPGASGGGGATPGGGEAPLATEKSIALVELELANFLSLNVADAPYPLAPVYGTQAADFSGVWTDRTVAAMRTFQRWANARQRVIDGKVCSLAALPEDGQPDRDSLVCLEAWQDWAIRQRAPAFIPGGGGGGTTPGGGGGGGGTSAADELAANAAARAAQAAAAAAAAQAGAMTEAEARRVAEAAAAAAAAAAQGGGGGGGTTPGGGGGAAPSSSSSSKGGGGLGALAVLALPFLL